MKSMKKLLTLLLVIVMGLGVMAGCSTTPHAESNQPTETAKPEEDTKPAEPAKAEEPAPLEPVTLVMYLLGDRSPDFDKVFAKINEKMQADINTTLEVKFLGWGEYEQKYPLIFASGEDFDIIYSADWSFYNAQATKGGYYEITQENLEKYAPMTASTIYPEAWQQVKVDGKAYMLPQNYKELTAYVYIVRGDLMKKYGIDKIESMDDYEKYLDAIAQNEKQMIPLDIGSDFDSLFMFDRMWGQVASENYDGVGPWQVSSCIPKDDPTNKIMHVSETPEFLQVVTKLKDWKERGFWSKSAVVNTATNKESFAIGKSASALLNINDAKSQYTTLTTQHPEWDVQVVDAMGNQPATLCSFLANGMSIFSKSKNPERALMALDLLRCDESYHDLFAYGIEGEHYELTPEGRVKTLPASANYPYDGNCNWGVRNSAFWKQLDGSMPNYEELYNHWLEKAAPIKYGTFNFNDANVKNEMAAVNEIFKTDYKLLGLGFTDDPAKDIAKLQKKLDAAGIDRIYGEMQKQIDALPQ